MGSQISALSSFPDLNVVLKHLLLFWLWVEVYQLWPFWVYNHAIALDTGGSILPGKSWDFLCLQIIFLINLLMLINLMTKKIKNIIATLKNLLYIRLITLVYEYESTFLFISEGLMIVRKLSHSW